MELHTVQNCVNTYIVIYLGSPEAQSAIVEPDSMMDVGSSNSASNVQFNPRQGRLHNIVNVYLGN